MTISFSLSLFFFCSYTPQAVINIYIFLTVAHVIFFYSTIITSIFTPWKLQAFQGAKSVELSRNIRFYVIIISAFMDN